MTGAGVSQRWPTTANDYQGQHDEDDVFDLGLAKRLFMDSRARQRQNGQHHPVQSLSDFKASLMV